MNAKLVLLCILFLLFLLSFRLKTVSNIARGVKNLRRYCLDPSSFCLSTPTQSSSKRIAICLSGQFRDIHACFGNHLDSLLPLGADFFIVGDELLPLAEKREVEEFYQPKAVRWNFINTSIPGHHLNTVRMFKRIYQCDQLRQAYEKENNFVYSAVIRIRPDLLITEPLPTIQIENLQENRMYVGQTLGVEELVNDHPYSYTEYMLSDQFFMGTSATMSNLSACYLWLKECPCAACFAETIFSEYVRSLEEIKFSYLPIPIVLHSKNVHKDGVVKGAYKIFKTIVLDKMFYAKGAIDCLKRYKDRRITFVDG
jgi:hypothetical protein